MLALSKQLDYELERFQVENGSIETVFIGGGTPSTVEPKLYEEIFAKLKGFLQKDAEITTEANPNSATRDWLREMRNLGVNRVSFGVQSFDDEKLKALGRRHNQATAIKSLKSARSVGFKNFSLDLIYNYKSDSREILSRDIDLALELGVTHISAYELTIEDGTKFSNTPEVAKRDDSLAKFVARKIEAGGLKQYEVSNFGKISKHNLGYWELKNYIGVGAGAVGFLRDFRIYPTTSIERYIKNPTKTAIEQLSQKDLTTERIFLGLRSCVGVDLDLISKQNQDRVKILEDEGKIELKNGKIYNKELFLADEVALFLME